MSDGRGAPRVRKAGDWHLIQHGTWQVSVSPDGLLSLPRHVHPEEWDDFVAAGEVAKSVAAEVIARNEKKAESDDRSLPARRAIVAQGGPPVGATRMRVTSAQHRAASIGRPKRNRAAAGEVERGATKRKGGGG